MSGYFLLVAVLFFWIHITYRNCFDNEFSFCKTTERNNRKTRYSKVNEKSLQKTFYIFCSLIYYNFCNRCCNFEHFQSSDLYEGLENLYAYIWALSFMPDYSDSGSVLFVFGIIAISFLFNLVFDFLLVFREIKLSRMKKIVCTLISLVMVSPYALLISFDCFFMWANIIVMGVSR